MASINEKLNYINETKNLIKDNLNNLGSEIDNETTFREYAEKIENLYEEWPKTSDIDINITLNNTKKAKMNIELKGNINQFTTTGRNKINEELLKQDANYNTYNTTTKLWTTNTDYNGDYNRSILYNASGYSSDRNANKIIDVKSNTTYTLKFYDATLVSYNFGYYNNEGTYISSSNSKSTQLRTFTTPENCTKLDIRRENPQTQLIFSKIMIIEGEYTEETIPSYEPYTGGIASPNPNYPQEVQVVTGTNKIKKQNDNLFNIYWFEEDSKNGITSSIQDGYLLLDGTATQDTYINFSMPVNSLNRNLNYWFVKSDVDLANLHINNTNESGTGSINITPTTTWSKTSMNNIKTTSGFLLISKDTVLNNCKLYIDIRDENIDLLNFSFQKHIEEIYDINLGIENLLNTSQNTFIFEPNQTYYQRLTKQIYQSQYETLYLQRGVTYYISYTIDNATTGNVRSTPRLYLDSSNYYQNTATNRNLTTGRKVDIYTPTKSGYYEVQYWLQGSNEQVSISNFMISRENGEYKSYNQKPIKLCKINDYQDYLYEENNKWYKYANIIEVILNGTESNWKVISNTSTFFNNSTLLADNYLIQNAYSNKYINQINNNIIDDETANNLLLDKYFTLKEGEVKDGIYIKDTSYNNIDIFKRELGIHNLKLYYILKTPISIEITDSVLISQLNALKEMNSYQNQTNISQIDNNNNLPFIITASALLKNSN